ncbi:hypothetical protein BBQ30_004910, partial [Escherichia coli]|nr:hypothetical protein [Escherichia coli]
LVGNRDYIKRAIRWRKMAGGGMRQSGILAAAGMYALKNNVARLQEDHDNAAWMAEQLREAGADVMRQDTNMLFVHYSSVIVITLNVPSAGGKWPVAGCVSPGFWLPPGCMP